MKVTVTLLFLILSISAADGKDLQDQRGQLEDKMISVPEATPVPYPIYQFVSTADGVSSYRVIGETEGKIKISTDGWLYLEEALVWSPEQRHSIKIEAVSADDETVDGPYAVTLIVQDVNNNPPIFTEKVYTGSIMERKPAGVPIVHVTASDNDDPETPNAALVYSIVSQIPDTPESPLFTIDPHTGRISTTEEGALTLKAQKRVAYHIDEVRGSPEVLRSKFEEYCTPVNEIPYEENPFFTCVQKSEVLRRNNFEDPDYTLLVRVEDLGGEAENALSGTALVHIVITQNLWVPPPPITIKENLISDYPKLIATVHANDPDALYRLVQKERSLEFPFSIDQEGQIFVNGPLDREAKDMYILVVFAEDEEGNELEPPMEIPVKVLDENDNAPVCLHDQAVLEVQENEIAGNVVGFVPVHDADDEKTPNALLSYTILSQTPDKPSATMFTVDGFSGKIQVANQNFIRRQVAEYKLNIKVADGGGVAEGHSIECEVTIKVIDLNNEIPIFERNDYGVHSIPELAEVGTQVLTIKANDADDPGTGSSKVEYFITSGDPHKMFAIEVDEDTGEGKVYIAKPLDYEEQHSYKLQIDARNPEPLVKGVEYDAQSTTVVVIDLVNIDEPPEFTMDSMEINVPENFTKGATILKIDAKDPEGQEIKFKMEGDELGWLELDENTGELKTKGDLDREAAEKINIKVTVFEKDAPDQKVERDLSIHLMDVNDNMPKLEVTTGFICVAKMTPIVLRASDSDGAPFGEPFQFSLGRKSPNWEVKELDGTSAHLILKKKPPKDDTFKVPVLIKDNAGMGVSQTFEVRVCNCTSLGYCYEEPGVQDGVWGMGNTIAILAGTIGFMLLVLVIVAHRIKKSNEKKKAAAVMAEAEGEAMM
ncbi:cadherin-17 [Chanos chanos]|uniref:Cadherin-17 n=1 Tax=Chanos chanos TaxID=29144 RepID=A0A6J2W740_CHACN|nr:cadherin-17 [Chanos chanos]